MRYLAFATDYDGTLARSGKVEPKVLEALTKLRGSGRRTLLVTGRNLEDLRRAFPELDHFDYVVAENGAVIYQPSTQNKELLAKPFPDKFMAELKQLEVVPLETGEVIIASHSSQKEKVLNAIQKIGLEAQIVFNGNSIMVIPHGINKATGTQYALRRMGLSFHEVVGIGDSENDHSLLDRCECPIAVSNAIDSIKEIAAHVTQGKSGDGVKEIIEALLENDLSFLAPKLTNHIELGKYPDGRIVWAPAYGQNLLIAGPSGSGKSTFAAGFIERLMAQRYQVCIIDPEGDYGTMQNVVAIGSPKRAPATSEVLGILEDPKINLSVNLLGIPLSDRAEFLAELLPSLQTMRARTGRPQWIVIDEAHHVLPKTLGSAPLTLPQRIGETIILTVHPDEVSPSILNEIDAVIAVGPQPEKTLTQFSRASGQHFSGPLKESENKAEVVAWFVKAGTEPFVMESIPGRADRIRHLRKYAEGDLGNHSFYFRGKNKLLNLKAQNLVTFNQISEGLDQDTWDFHFRKGDYSSWFRKHLKDEFLASETQRLEQRQDLPVQDARNLVCELIRARYTI